MPLVYIIHKQMLLIYIVHTVTLQGSSRKYLIKTLAFGKNGYHSMNNLYQKHLFMKIYISEAFFH